MSTDTPNDALASSREQDLVLVSSRHPGSREFHEPKQDHRSRPRCNRFDHDGQLVPRWYAESPEHLGRRACTSGCFLEEAEA